MITKWFRSIALGILLLGGMQPAVAALQVFACEPEWGALVEELGGNDIDVFVATTALQDPHNIQARPSLIARTRNADLMVCSGAELEIGWLPLLLRQSGNRKVQVGKPGYFEAASFVERLNVPQRVSRVFGDVHPSGSPHVHLDPRRMLQIADALNTRLQQLDTANKADYQRRYEDFHNRMEQSIQEWERRAGPLQGKKAVVHHKDWAYLFDWLQIEEVGTLEPKPGQPPTAGHLAELKSRLETQPADFIIRAAYQDPRAANWLHQNTGITMVDLAYTVGGSKGANDLLGLYDDMLTRLLAVVQ